MDKKEFRKGSTEGRPAAGYPTHEQFARDRRSFLVGLLAAVVSTIAPASLAHATSKNIPRKKGKEDPKDKDKLPTKKKQPSPPPRHPPEYDGVAMMPDAPIDD
jgi:hypothetical protein